MTENSSWSERIGERNKALGEAIDVASDFSFHLSSDSINGRRPLRREGLREEYESLQGDPKFDNFRIFAYLRPEITGEPEKAWLQRLATFALHVLNAQIRREDLDDASPFTPDEQRRIERDSLTRAAKECWEKVNAVFPPQQGQSPAR